MLTAAHDPLCDQGRAYAHRPEREGVRVAAVHVGDQPHELLTMGAVIGPADLYVRLIGADLRVALEDTHAP